MTWSRQLRALAVPGTVTVLVPALLLLGGSVRPGWGLPGVWQALALVVGAAFVLAGLTLVVRTVRLFATEGKGTLAPWDPPRRMVVRGPYRYVRNPMISGVMAILLGEVLLFGTLSVLVWFGVFVVVNATYIPLYEERSLDRRFGEDYADYRRAVPRWLPRPTPWQPAR
jgi:protein-S-isoprenylcysteine O-methyltransferase Ste14